MGLVKKFIWVSLLLWKNPNELFGQSNRILDWQSRPPSPALWMCHPLLPSVVSDEKSAVNLVEAPSHVTNCILLAAMKSLFVSIVHSLRVSVVTLWVTLSLLSFSYVQISVFHHIWMVSAITSSDIYSAPFSILGFRGGSDGKESACNAGDLGLIPGEGRSPGEGHGNLLQCSCLENPMDRGACRLQSMGLQRVGHNWSDWA